MNLQQAKNWIAKLESAVEDKKISIFGAYEEVFAELQDNNDNLEDEAGEYLYRFTRGEHTVNKDTFTLVWTPKDYGLFVTSDAIKDGGRTLQEFDSQSDAELAAHKLNQETRGGQGRYAVIVEIANA